MEDKYENIDGLFRDKLENFSPEPPQDIWDNIHSRINTVKSSIWSWWQVAASIIAITSVGLALWLTRGEKEVIVAENDAVIYEESTRTENIISKDLNSEMVAANQSVEQVKNDDNLMLARNKQKERKRLLENYKKSSEGGDINNLNNLALQISSEQENKRYINDLIPLTGIDKKLFTSAPEKYNLQEKSYEKPNVSVQENEKEKRSFWTSISVGGQLSPILSYRNAGGANVGSGETPLITSSGGIYIEGNLAGRLNIKTGLYYLQIGNYQNDIWYRKAFSNLNYRTYPWESFSVPEQEEVDNVAFNNSIGVIALNDNAVVESDGDALLLISSGNENNKYAMTNDQVNEEAFLNQDQNRNGDIYKKLDAVAIQKFNNIEIPVIFSYNIIKSNKISINLISGFSANILVKNYVFIKEDKSIIGETVNINQFNMSSTLGIGIEYPIISRMSITIEPTFKYFLNSINIDRYARIHPYTVGVYSGVRFSF